MNINQRSVIISVSVFIAGAIFLGYVYQLDISAHNEPIVKKDKLITIKEENIAKKKLNDIQTSQNKLVPKSDMLKIYDPDLIEIKGFPKLVQINLGDDVITREFSSMEIRKFPIITLENSDDYINALKPLVDKGSGPAANKLHGLLESCLTAPRDEVTYSKNQIAIMEENRATHGMSVDQHLDYNTAQFLLCKDVVDADLQEESLNELFELAIENGSQLALTELATSHLYNSDYDQAGARLKELWESGDTNAGAGLSFVYKNTDFDGPDPTRPSLVKSHAFQLAQEMVNNAALGTTDYFNTPLNSVREGNERAAREIAASQLTLQQFEEAEELAKNLIKNNENCCIWIWSTE